MANSHQQFVLSYLEKGDYAEFTLADKTILSIPRREILKKQEQLYRQWVKRGIDTTGVLQHAQRICIKNHIRRLEKQQQPAKSTVQVLRFER